MSPQRLALSSDLRRLRDDGYEIEIRSGHLLMHHVPYVNAERALRFGTLISTLDLAGDVTVRPHTHVAYFTGDHPCHQDGTLISQIRHSTANQVLAPDVIAQHSFSNKPAAGFADYYEKMVSYANIISGPAAFIDPNATAQTHKPIESTDDNSPFWYEDTASSRAGIAALAQKFRGMKIAIIGLGGTGSYVLDFIAKTPVSEIHLFDRDLFLQHNAFRAPGAPSIEKLRERPRKVEYFAGIYSAMHRKVIPHRTHIDESNLSELDGMTFVFICVDDGVFKRSIVESLERANVPFVDVGMGIENTAEGLTGVLRVTASTPTSREHVHAKGRIPFTNGGNNDYAGNIQIADLNALNAVLAVIKWKKLCGFYRDHEKEHYSTYTVDAHLLTGEDLG